MSVPVSSSDGVISASMTCGWNDAPHLPVLLNCCPGVGRPVFRPRWCPGSSKVALLKEPFGKGLGDTDRKPHLHAEAVVQSEMNCAFTEGICCRIEPNKKAPARPFTGTARPRSARPVSSRKYTRQNANPLTPHNHPHADQILSTFTNSVEGIRPPSAGVHPHLPRSRDSSQEDSEAAMLGHQPCTCSETLGSTRGRETETARHSVADRSPHSDLLFSSSRQSSAAARPSTPNVQPRSARPGSSIKHAPKAARHLVEDIQARAACAVPRSEHARSLGRQDLRPHSARSTFSNKHASEASELRAAQHAFSACFTSMQENIKPSSGSPVSPRTETAKMVNQISHELKCQKCGVEDTSKQPLTNEHILDESTQGASILHVPSCPASLPRLACAVPLSEHANDLGGQDVQSHSEGSSLSSKHASEASELNSGRVFSASSTSMQKKTQPFSGSPVSPTVAVEMVNSISHDSACPKCDEENTSLQSLTNEDTLRENTQGSSSLQSSGCPIASNCPTSSQLSHELQVSPPRFDRPNSGRRSKLSWNIERPSLQEAQLVRDTCLRHMGLEQPMQEILTREDQSSKSEQQQDHDRFCSPATGQLSEMCQEHLQQFERIRKSLPAAKLISNLTLHMETLREADEAWFNLLASVQTPKGSKSPP